MLGSDLVATVPDGTMLVAPPSRRLDIRDHAEVDALLAASRPDVVINTAAYTRVDDAEEHEAEAHAVNADAVGALGRACAHRGVLVVHYSTDYVFSGDASRPYGEDDRVAPLGAYGRSKLAGERQLQASQAKALILRTQWLFGRSGRSFPRTMRERAASGLATRVVSDQRGCPTYTVDLARATWSLVAEGAEGLFHAVNDGDATWYDLAREVFESLGVGPLLSPCATSDYPTRARRPVDSRLNTEKLAGVLGHALPPWRDALRRYLDEAPGTR